MFSPRPLLFAAAFAAVLVGCATGPTPPSADEYQPPVANASVATLKGSRITEGGMFGDEHTGFVNMIDLTPVHDAADRWDQPITLTAGRHAIMAEYHYSNFKGRMNLMLTASAGGSYQLMIQNGHESTPDGRLYCDFWIVDVKTGTIVAPVHRAQVMGGKKGTIFNVPT
jgi:hypothetical protein